MRLILYILLLVLYALHNDLWLWDDGSLVLGLPAGFLYHIGYCVAAAGLLGPARQLRLAPAPVRT